MTHIALVSKFKKLYAKIKSGQSDGNITFDDLVYVLERCGFERQGGKGSHHYYVHPSGKVISLPYHGKDMKRVYVAETRELI